MNKATLRMYAMIAGLLLLAAIIFSEIETKGKIVESRVGLLLVIVTAGLLLFTALLTDKPKPPPDDGGPPREARTAPTPSEFLAGLRTMTGQPGQPIQAEVKVIDATKGADATR